MSEVKVFFRLNSVTGDDNVVKLGAVDCVNDEDDPFIISYDHLRQDGSVGKKYLLFPSFEYFLKNRDKYPHSHEIMVCHNNCDKEYYSGGRLVFDFDIKDRSKVPENFTEQVESIIIETFQNHYCDVNKKIMKFVWSSSNSPNKFSKHLTVKNAYFYEWTEMMKIFYKLFMLEWEKHHSWISKVDICDFQIARKNGSLRMVGSSKIDNPNAILSLDDDKYTLEDSLIRIYKDEIDEQTITLENLCTSENVVTEKKKKKIDYTSSKKMNISDDLEFDKEIYDEAFKSLNKKCKNVFEIRNISCKMIALHRIKEHKCLLSGKVHETENAYITISKYSGYYRFYFGCYRNCNEEKKTKLIGKIECEQELKYDEEIYDQAFELFNKKYDGMFEMGKINDSFISLEPTNKYRCPISNKKHNDETNAYLAISKNDDMYYINFGCSNKCETKKSKKTILIDTIYIYKKNSNAGIVLY